MQCCRRNQSAPKRCPEVERRRHCSQQKSLRKHHNALIALRDAVVWNASWGGNYVADPKRGRNESRISGWTEDRRYIVDRQSTRRSQILSYLEMILPDDR